MGAASVTIISDFEWSGQNCHEDRREASLKLRCLLRDVLAQHPNAFHFLIGHSHAGNIILHTILRWRRLQETLCGAICIATPFLKFHHQSPMLLLLPTTLTHAGAGAAFWLLINCLTLIVSVLFFIVTFPLSWLYHWLTGTWGLQNAIDNWTVGQNFIERIEQLDPRILVLVSVVVVLLLGGIQLNRSRKVAVSEFAKEAAPKRRKLLRQFAYFQPKQPLARVPILALSSLIDEAHGALVGSWWAHRTATLVVRAMGVLGIIVVTLFGMVVYAGSLYVYVKLHTSSWGMIVGPLFAVFFFFAATISLLIAGYVTLLLAQACAKFGPGLNLGSAQSSMLVSSTAHRKPFVQSNLRHVRFSFWRLLRESNELLFHSRLYSCRPAVRMMAEWMAERSGDVAKI